MQTQTYSRCAKCGVTLRDEWAFCPKCGRDVRPPALRTSVDCPDHEIADGEYCINCGRSILDQAIEESEPDLGLKVAAAWAGLVGGSVLAGVGQMIMMANRPKSLDEEGAAILGPAAWMVRFGILFAILGFGALIALPSIRRRG